VEEGRLYSMTEVCELLGIRYHKLYYAEYQGLLPKPRKIGTCRVYTEAELQRLKAYFKGAK